MQCLAWSGMALLLLASWAAPAALRGSLAAIPCQPLCRNEGLVARSAGGSLVDKLRAKGNRPKPVLRESEAAAPISSALPPGTVAPELTARIHQLLQDRPDLLATASKASDFVYTEMGPEDAEDLLAMQDEWFPQDSYPGGAPWCAELLGHPGVIAIKASILGEESMAPAGLVVALSSREAIEEFTGAATVDLLRSELTIPRRIPWDSPERRELGYILSLGTVGEVRRRGLAAELLQRAIAQLRVSCDQAAGIGGGTSKGEASTAPDDLLKGLLSGTIGRSTALRAVALNLADYNKAARKCYEAAGFQILKEEPEFYAGVGRRTHSALLYALFMEPEK